MQVDEVRRIEAEHALWRAGSLRHLLDDHQLRIYDPYREWEERRLNEPKTGVHRLFMGECGRQVGKTYTFSTIRVEDGQDQRFANEIIMMGASTEIALKELVIPTINRIIESAPDDIRPKFFTSRWGMRAGYHCPATDCVLKLVGFEDPDSLRGTGIAGCNISEAAFVPKLAYAVNSIILPMFSRRPRATIVLESSTVKDHHHPFERVFKPDAQKRTAYAFMTLWDNTALADDEKQAMFEASKAINQAEAEREFECKLTRDLSVKLVPEFDKAKHVEAVPRPKYACGIAASDPGHSDLFFNGWGYWHPQRQQLIIEHDWSGRNKTTGFIAPVWKDIERMCFGQASEFAREKPKRHGYVDVREEYKRILRVLSGEEEPDRGTGLGINDIEGLAWWRDGEFRENPVIRVSDTSSQLIADLTEEFGITVCPTAKDDADAQLYALRNAFKFDKIRVHPRCVDLIRHLDMGEWNERRTDWKRFHEGEEAELYGHFDGVAMSIYMWRNVLVVMNVNPEPPVYRDRFDPGVMHTPEDWQHNTKVHELEAWA